MVPPLEHSEVPCKLYGLFENQPTHSLLSLVPQTRRVSSAPLADRSMGQIVFAGGYIHTAHESHTLNVGQGGLASLGFPKPLGFHVKMLSASIHVPRNDKDLWKIRVCLPWSGWKRNRQKPGLRQHTLAIASRLLTRNGVQSSEPKSPLLISAKRIT